MRKTMSLKQIAANRRNAQKSTGPKTPNGRAVSKMNALKHGILSKEVLVHGKYIQEDDREFTALHQRLWEDLNPVGPVEEILVEQIVTTTWRWRRALKAESGEIALSVDTGRWERSHRDLTLTTMLWGMSGDPGSSMRNSALGNHFLENQLKAVRASVEKEGELTEAAIQSVTVHGKPYSLTRELEKLRSQWQQNPEGLEATALRARQKEQALAAIDKQLRFISWDKSECEEHEEMEEEARQAAAVLPPPEVLDKIIRYSTMLERQLYRAMNQLERWQRMRQGEAVPPPLTMEVSERA
jgi:hypothetical protein